MCTEIDLVSIILYHIYINQNYNFCIGKKGEKDRVVREWSKIVIIINRYTIGRICKRGKVIQMVWENDDRKFQTRNDLIVRVDIIMVFLVQIYCNGWEYNERSGDGKEVEMWCDGTLCPRFLTESLLMADDGEFRSKKLD